MYIRGYTGKAHRAVLLSHATHTHTHKQRDRGDNGKENFEATTNLYYNPRTTTQQHQEEQDTRRISHPRLTAGGSLRRRLGACGCTCRHRGGHNLLRSGGRSVQLLVLGNAVLFAEGLLGTRCLCDELRNVLPTWPTREHKRLYVGYKQNRTPILDSSSLGLTLSVMGVLRLCPLTCVMYREIVALQTGESQRMLGWWIMKETG